MRERNLAASRVAFLPRMDPARYRAVIAHADVMLDTQHFSGCLTTLDALALGTPVVTLPGRFMRGRQSMAMLQSLGLHALIATDTKGYVETAIEFAHSGQLRRDVAEACASGRNKIFGRRDAVAALADHLEAVHLAHQAARH